MASRTRPPRMWGSFFRSGPRLRAWLGTALILVGSTSGCGYTVRNSLPAHLKTLAIPVFGNNTVEFGLADDITLALTNGFLNNRQLRIVQERDANAVLRGTVVAYKNQVFGYTTTERATQYEIVLTVQATFRDMVKNRDLWKEDALVVRTTYNVVQVGSEPARTEAEGRKEVIQKLADMIVSRTVEGW